MLMENKGRPYRSKPVTYSSGATEVIDPVFLQPAMSRMSAPVVRELLFHFNGSVSGVTATLVGEDAFTIFDRLTVRDRGGTLFDLPGKLARVVEQIELGTRQLDPAAVASGATNTDYDVFLRVIFDTEKAHRGADTALPLTHLLEGGDISIRFGTPAGSTVNSGTVRCYAVVHDERKRQLKSRMTWVERAITATEDSYPVGGSLRCAFVCSSIATAYTSLSAVSAIDSPELGYQDLSTKILEQEYRRTSPDFNAGDEFIADNAIMLVNPSGGQHIGKMPDLDAFTVDVEDSITGGRMVLCTLKDRDLGLGAEWCGYQDVNDFAKRLREQGMVNTKGGAPKSVNNFPARLARRLPIDL